MEKTDQFNPFASRHAKGHCDTHSRLRRIGEEKLHSSVSENNAVLRMISEKIKSQEQELDSKSSTTSGSTKTSKIKLIVICAREEGPT